MRSKLLLSAALLAAVALAGCGSKPAEQTTTPTATSPSAVQETKTPPTTPTAAKGARYVAASGSTASYGVRETFLGRNLNATAVGTTAAVKGEIILDGGVIQPSTVQVDLGTLKSDEDRRDNQVRRALDTTNHPNATFQITGAEGNPVLKDGQETALKLQGNMTIKGTTKPLTFDTKATLKGDTVTLTAESTFAMTTFGVTPPNMAGFVAVVDEVKLTVNFTGKSQ